MPLVRGHSRCRKHVAEGELQEFFVFELMQAADQYAVEVSHHDALALSHKPGEFLDLFQPPLEPPVVSVLAFQMHHEDFQSSSAGFQLEFQEVPGKVFFNVDRGFGKPPF